MMAVSSYPKVALIQQDKKVFESLEALAAITDSLVSHYKTTRQVFCELQYLVHGHEEYTSEEDKTALIKRLRGELGYMLEAEIRFLIGRLNHLTVQVLDVFNTRINADVGRFSRPLRLDELLSEDQTDAQPVLSQIRDTLKGDPTNRIIELRIVDSDKLQRESREWVAGNNIDYDRWDEIIATVAMACEG
eukprot:gb/GECG01010705.1/.p1 GENE.gb/GECG01010705.1/~~gb/GECG01010705.1/.p1  ORF type:complete len:190 (+),score=18.29 gb/GECG01010705.1/:1-570(+)